MKTAGKLFGVAALFGLVAGCGTVPVREGQAVTTVDHGKMAVVNEHARERGIDVIWVNPPTKKERKEKDEP